MITYGCTHHGLQWDFELEENFIVIWQGKKPDFLCVPVEDQNKLVTMLGSRGKMSEWLADRLDEKSVCRISVPEKVTFSNVFL